MRSGGVICGNTGLLCSDSELMWHVGSGTPPIGHVVRVLTARLKGRVRLVEGARVQFTDCVLEALTEEGVHEEVAGTVADDQQIAHINQYRNHIILIERVRHGPFKNVKHHAQTATHEKLADHTDQHHITCNVKLYMNTS